MSTDQISPTAKWLTLSARQHSKLPVTLEPPPIAALMLGHAEITSRQANEYRNEILQSADLAHHALTRYEPVF